MFLTMSSFCVQLTLNCICFFLFQLNKERQSRFTNENKRKLSIWIKSKKKFSICKVSTIDTKRENKQIPKKNIKLAKYLVHKTM